MAEHQNISRVQAGYEAFANGDFPVLDDFFDENVVWHVDGRNQLAGTYHGRNEVYEFFGRIMELTGGSFRIAVHTILADDDHGVALVTSTASREGRTVTTQDAHVFHLRDGKVTEFWDASTDQYATDELLG